MMFGGVCLRIVKLRHEELITFISSNYLRCYVVLVFKRCDKCFDRVNNFSYGFQTNNPSESTIIIKNGE